MSTIPLFIYAGYLLAEARHRRSPRAVRERAARLDAGRARDRHDRHVRAVHRVHRRLGRHDHRARRRADAGARAQRLPRAVLDRPHRRHRLGRPLVPACPAAVHLRHGLRPHQPRSRESGTRGGSCSPASCRASCSIGMLSAVAVTVAIVQEAAAPEVRRSASSARASSLALPELFIPFGVILGLASGIGLPEVAALTVRLRRHPRGRRVALLVSSACWGKPLDPRVLWTTTREAMAMVGAIFIIIFASTALTELHGHRRGARRSSSRGRRRTSSRRSCSCSRST